MTKKKIDRESKIIVKPIFRKEIDVEKICKALLMLAELNSKKK
ncbi:hypothetical protein [Enterococcus raffinosus]|jgi:hypothetical protein|nr:hypothetical protein [Enterococcus raffinosus]